MTRPPKPINVAPYKGVAMDLEDFKRSARQFLSIKGEISLLTNRQADLKNRLLQEIDVVEADDKGHRVLEFEDTIGQVKVTKQRKVSKTLDMNVAETILTKKGIKDTCVKMVPTLDEAAIMSAFYEGYLTEEDIDAMFPAKEIFAFIVDSK